MHSPSTACTEYSMHRVQHILSTAYTKYSIHRILHTPSTVYTEYSIHWVRYLSKNDCLPFILMITSWPLNVASASSEPPHLIDRHYPARHENLKIKSPCQIPTFPSQLTDELTSSNPHTIHQLPASICPISLDHILQCVSLNSLVDGLLVCKTIASKCIFYFTRLRPTSESPMSLDNGPKGCTMMAGKRISTLAPSRSWSPSLPSFDNGLQLNC